jgi:hypothetical protein
MAFGSPLAAGALALVGHAIPMDRAGNLVALDQPGRRVAILSQVDLALFGIDSSSGLPGWPGRSSACAMRLRTAGSS